MNGNTPYAGMPGVQPVGDSFDDGAALTSEEKRRLRRELARVADQVRTYLPDEFVVGSELSNGLNGIEATVAVHPPVGDAVSAGFRPPSDGSADEEFLDESTRIEVARGLAASAVFQARLALAEDLPPTAQ